MDDPIIKSVRRVFEVLELFDAEQRPLPVKEIADRLEYPLVSAHALLKSMYLLGYLNFTHAKRAYSPSRSLPAILEWIPDFLDHEEHVIEFAKALNEKTQETVNISRRVGARTRVVHGFECKYPIGVSSQVGTMMPILHTITGLAAIAGLDPEEREWIMNNERKMSPERVLDMDMIAGVMRDFARDGMAMRCDLFIEGIGAICLPVRSQNSKEALVVGVAGPSERITANSAQYREAVTELASQFGIEIASTQLRA